MRRLREVARNIRHEAAILWIAYHDPRAPWYAKGIVLLAAVLALSPVDLIPDVVPVLGHVDDVIVVPALILLARALMPREVLAAAAERYKREGLPPLGIQAFARAIIAFLWIAVALAAAYLGWWIVTKGE